MNALTFAAELAINRAAYERLREQIRRTSAGHYAAIANGRLIIVTDSFDAAVVAVNQLQPLPEHFLVFPADEEPAFDVIDDFSQRL
jgi:histidinol dehydrogenase